MQPQEPQTLPLVRHKVRDILTGSAAFRGLSEKERRELAHNMVKVAHYIIGGEDGRHVPRSAALPTALAGGGTRDGSAVQPSDPAGDTASARLGGSGATAASEGTEAFTQQIEDVDFPEFVAGLIDGVFNAIVDSSIQQMEAYAEMVKNVAKSVDQYMKDNVSKNQARDYLVSRYPEHLQLDLDGDEPKVKPRDGQDEENLPDFFADLGLTSPVDSVDEETTEDVLVPAARRRIAMDRQQLLATMVMMGINRLVVTDGTIEAGVTFELNTKDSVNRHFQRTSDTDRSGNRVRYKRPKSRWYGGVYEMDTRKIKVSTVQKEDSEAQVELKTKLSGNVKVRFKSDYFPLEKMVDVLQVEQVQQKAPGYPGTAAPAAATPAPAAATPAPAAATPAR